MIGDNALGLGLFFIMGGIAALGMVFFAIKWLIEGATDWLPRKKKRRDYLDYNDTWEP